MNCNPIVKLVLASVIAVSSTAMAASTDPVRAARAYLAAVYYGDGPGAQKLRTSDAVFVNGKTVDPIFISVYPSIIWRHCKIGPPTLKRRVTDPNILGKLTPPSIRDGYAATVESQFTCRTDTGQIRTPVVRLIITKGKVAVFEVAGSK